MFDAEILDVSGSSHYDGGTSFGVIFPAKGKFSSLEIIVKSETPVKKLNFQGCWPLEKGDSIRVYVDLLIPNHGLSLSESLREEPSYREKLNEQESPAKIEKLRNNEVVATYFNGPKF